MKQAPCKPDGHDCENRFVGCSRTCPAFQEWTRYREKIKAERLKEIDRYRPTGRRFVPRCIFPQSSRE